MLDAMLQRGFAKRTQKSYVEAIYRMAKYYRRDPATYSAEEVQAYLLHMVKDDHLSYSTMNQAACAARFLFESVLGKGRSVFQIPMAKVPAKQPELLAREEIARLFASCESLLHRVLLQTVYATGLRVADLNENQHHVSAHKAVLTGEIGAGSDIAGRRNAETNLTPCPGEYFLRLRARLQRQKQNSRL
jgi:site-specific recombinase XerD